jgi:membrane protein
VAKFFYREVNNSKLSERAAAVTYNFIMAIPPTMLFLFSLIPYLPLRDVQQTILDTIQIIAPNKNIFESISGIIIDFMNTERRDLLSFGVLMTVFFSSNGMMGLMKTFDRSLPVYVKRSGYRRRWTALKLTVLIIMVAIATIAALIVQTEALNDIITSALGSLIPVRIFSILIIIALIFCTICIIYTYGPSLSDRFNFISPGSVFATLLSVVSTAVFFFLINNFLNYNKVYGSIGTLIALLVWLYLNTVIILLGYELNISILLGKISQKKHAAEHKTI